MFNDNSKKDSQMKKLFILFLLIAVLCFFTGCGTTYLVNLKSGQVYETKKKPKVDEDEGFITVKTKDGKKLRVNKDEVLTIEEK
jgi:major membrane immunogen (membrane-anchored lipoprotein)